jgi:4,5-DOPA dioxygenase extradiol
MLRRSGSQEEAPAPDWVRNFADWTSDRIAAGATEDILHYRERAPFARENHPTEEHFLPLPFAMGAAGANARGRRAHTSHQYGVLMMDAYVFD